MPGSTSRRRRIRSMAISLHWYSGVMLAKAVIQPSGAMHGCDRTAADILRVKPAQREALFGAVHHCQPFVADLTQLGSGRHLERRAGKTWNVKPSLLDVVERGTVGFVCLAFERDRSAHPQSLPAPMQIASKPCALYAASVSGSVW